MDEMLVVSLLAPNARPAHAAIVARLAARTELPLRLADGRHWREQLALLDAGEAQAAFVCGLPYTARSAALEALAAPVQASERYADRPLYYSDMVVRVDSPCHRFADLRGARLAYNEPGSLSGYAILRAHLAAIGAPTGFFGAAIESGSHLESLRLVLEGAADTAAIDSTVLDLARRDDPSLAVRLRSVAALGPSPAPPFVASRAIPAALRGRLRTALGTLHEDAAGRAALALGILARFAPVADADYDPIRRLAEYAAGVSFTKDKLEERHAP